jgi:hypothetical protein
LPKLYSLVVVFALVQLVFVGAALAKSDWVEDQSDNPQTGAQRTRDLGNGSTDYPNPDAQMSEQQDGATEPGADVDRSAPASTSTSVGAGAESGVSKKEPLQAEVSRSDETAPLETRQNVAIPDIVPPFPMRAPYEPPRQVRATSTIYQNWLNSTHKSLQGALTAKDKGKIIEIQGPWDDAGHALHTFGLPYTRISSSQLLGRKLDDVRVMIVDCGSNLSPGAENIIRQFVYTGGSLLTTDWALDSCLSRCFPGFLEANGRYSEAAVVDASVVSDDRNLVQGTASPSYWKLEKRSQFVRQISPRVEILARSRDILRQDPWGEGILAATFSYGRGRVLHLVGHFDTNSTGAFTSDLVDPSPGIVVSLRQALAANFILSALGID